MTENDEQFDEDEIAADRWYERKEELYQQILGEQEELVQHAIVPYELGGTLDLYFYSKKIPGTAVVTMELSPYPDEGPSNEVFDRYEIVMFTEHSYDLELKSEEAEVESSDTASPFRTAIENFYPILNLMGRYSEQATLNPYETVEFPSDMEEVGGRCLVLDQYGDEHDEENGFGLLLIMEIFRSEMEFAREEGSEMLFERLRLQGHYPYSDLDRESVV